VFIVYYLRVRVHWHFEHANMLINESCYCVAVDRLFFQQNLNIHASYQSMKQLENQNLPSLTFSDAVEYVWCYTGYTVITEIELFVNKRVDKPVFFSRTVSD